MTTSEFNMACFAIASKDLESQAALDQEIRNLANLANSASVTYADVCDAVLDIIWSEEDKAYYESK